MDYGINIDLDELKNILSKEKYIINKPAKTKFIMRKALQVVRKLWHLPYTTHCNLLPAFAFGDNFCSIIHNQFVNFSRDCLSSNNVHIKFIALLAVES